MRNEPAIKRAHDGVRHQTRLMGHEGKGECELGRVSADVSPHAPKMAGPGNASRVGHDAGGHVHIDRKGHRDHHKQTPQSRASRERWSMRQAATTLSRARSNCGADCRKSSSAKSAAGGCALCGRSSPAPAGKATARSANRRASSDVVALHKCHSARGNHPAVRCP